MDNLSNLGADLVAFAVLVRAVGLLRASPVRAYVQCRSRCGTDLDLRIRAVRRIL